MASTLLARSSFPRSPDDRLIAGVCGGLAARWRLDPAVVRIGAMALVLCGGVGVALYLGAILVMPAPTTDTTLPAPVVGDGDRVDNFAALSIVAGTMLVLRAGDVWFSDSTALVGGVAIAGIGLVWGRTASDHRGSVTGQALRIAVGLALVVGGSVAFAGLWSNAGELVRGVFAAVVVGAGAVVLVGPYMGRLSRELTVERRARVRVEERAEIAAHLHDGVLQTLALIQQRAGDERIVSNLARRQERELRDWLYAPAQGGGHSLAAEVRRVVAEVEDAYGARIEVVCVGDRPLDEQGQALTAAVREAAVNAARHSGASTVDVFAEIGDSVEAFVRDRGVGFDPGAVSGDRHGIAESIVGRMQRIGGAASVRSAPGDGTEVELTLPGAQS